MHMMLSRSRYVAEGGFAVPGDFVEAPPQMLEAWVGQGRARHLRRGLPRSREEDFAQTIASLVEARQATAAYTTRRQQAFGILDLELHTVSKGRTPRRWISSPSPMPRSRAPRSRRHRIRRSVAYFGHLAGGYDAGYYGYLWAKVMALDMASIFKAAPGGFLDEKVGMRLRNEVYGVGNTRDVAESVEMFLAAPARSRLSSKTSA